jgi:tetratricopeptide (TPR) repeat protein
MASWAGITVRDWDRRLDATIRWELSQALMDRGWYQQAVTELKQVRRVFPDQARVEALLGTAHLLGGDPAKGEERLRAALELSPHSAEINGLLGNIWIQKGEWRRGCALLERALHGEPDWDHLRWVLVETYLDRGEARKAGPHLKLLRPGSREEQALRDFFYARYWSGIGDFGPACVHAAEAVARKPAKPEFLREYGLALAQVNRADQAVPFLARALASGLRDETLMHQLGEALFRERHWENAETVWTSATKLHPHSAALKLRLMDFFLQSGQREKAERFLDAQAADGQILSRLLRCRFERKVGVPALAARRLEKLKRQARGEYFTLALWEEACLYFDQGRLKDFEHIADRLLRSGFRVDAVYLLKAQAALYRRDKPSARRYLENARQANPFSVDSGKLARILDGGNSPPSLAQGF